MNNKYIARFTAMAKVEIEVQVSGDNQTEGLVHAHDAVLQATPAQAKVVELLLDGAKNISFKAAEPFHLPVESVPTIPTAVDNRFVVEFYSLRDCKGQRLSAVRTGDEAAARLVLSNRLENQTSVEASGCIRDASGMQIFLVNANRGGWEVELVFKEDNAFHSWQASREDAARVAIKAFSDTALLKACIYDFTNREVGPVLRDVIQ